MIPRPFVNQAGAPIGDVRSIMAQNGIFNGLVQTAAIDYNPGTISVNGTPERVNRWNNAGRLGSDLDLRSTNGTGIDLTKVTNRGEDAVDFGGTVSIETLTGTDITAPFTYAIAFNLDTVAVAANEHLVTARSDSGADPTFWLSSGGKFCYDDGAATVITGPDVKTGFQVAIIRQNATQAKMKISGEAEVTGNLTGPAEDKLDAITLGGHRDGVSAMFNGQAQRFMLWERELSDYEVGFLEAELIERYTALHLIAEAIAYYDEAGIVGSSPVTRWNNAGTLGSALDLVTVNGTAAGLTTTTHNDRTVVDFAGNVSIETASGTTIENPLTLLVVMEVDSTTNVPTLEFVVTARANGSEDQGIYVQTDETYRWVAGNQGGLVGPSLKTGYQSVVVRVTEGQGVMDVSGESPVTRANDPAPEALDALTLGSSFTGSANFFNGRIACAAMWGRTLSDDEVAIVQKQMADEYAI